MQKFHLAQLVSIYTGVLIPTPGTDYPIDGVYDILNYMVGESLQTIALPRVAEECRPYLGEAFPWLEQIKNGIALAGVNKDNWPDALEQWVSRYGEWHEVRPIHGEDHEVINPVDELLRYRPDLGAGGITVINATDADEPSPYGDIDWKVDDDQEAQS